MFPAVGRDLQIRVAMEASFSSRFLAELPMPLPVPSCKFRCGRVPSSCCLIAVQRADVAASQPGILLSTVSCGTCCVAVSFPSGLSPLSSPGTVSKPVF